MGSDATVLGVTPWVFCPLVMALYTKDVGLIIPYALTQLKSGPVTTTLEA
jgi:hypothetical protein